MEIKTKFNLGDEVFVINCYSELVKTKCPICNGNKFINIKGRQFKCPNKDCYDGYLHHREDRKWHIAYNSFVGNIKFEVYRDYGGIEISYMIDQTGIGTGSVWRENTLFATEEEAQARCDELNKELEKQKTNITK